MTPGPLTKAQSPDNEVDEITNKMGKITLETSKAPNIQDQFQACFDGSKIYPENLCALLESRSLSELQLLPWDTPDEHGIPPLYNLAYIAANHESYKPISLFLNKLDSKTLQKFDWNKIINGISCIHLLLDCAAKKRPELIEILLNKLDAKTILSLNWNQENVLGQTLLFTFSALTCLYPRFIYLLLQKLNAEELLTLPWNIPSPDFSRKVITEYQKTHNPNCLFMEERFTPFMCISILPDAIVSFIQKLNGIQIKALNWNNENIVRVTPIYQLALFASKGTSAPIMHFLSALTSDDLAALNLKWDLESEWGPSPLELLWPDHPGVIAYAIMSGCEIGLDSSQPAQDPMLHFIAAVRQEHKKIKQDLPRKLGFLYRECRFPVKPEEDFRFIPVNRDVALLVLRNIVNDVFTNKHLATIPIPLRKKLINSWFKQFNHDYDTIAEPQEAFAVATAKKCVQKMYNRYQSHGPSQRLGGFETLRNTIREAINNLEDKMLTPAFHLLGKHNQNCLIAEIAASTCDEVTIEEKLTHAFKQQPDNNQVKKKKGNHVWVTNKQMQESAFGRRISDSQRPLKH